LSFKPGSIPAKNSRKRGKKYSEKDLTIFDEVLISLIEKQVRVGTPHPTQRGKSEAKNDAHQPRKI